MEAIEHTPFAPAFIESSRFIGYSLEAAVSDIIDNSIAAHAKNVYIHSFFDEHDDAYFYILDDGEGMEEAALHEAMRYGSRMPSEVRAADDLGRYGLGLKTASMSQCRKLTVISKTPSGLYGRCWDIDFVLEQKKWMLLKLNQDDIEKLPGYAELLKQEQGTLVVWQHLDRMFIGESNIVKSLSTKLDVLQGHLSLVFHRYLHGEANIVKMNIFLNNRLIEPINPFYKAQQIMDDEIIHIKGSDVRVCPYTLPHISHLTKDELDTLSGIEGLRRGQGFYVYRNKRLIVWGTWFRLMRQGEHSKLARVRVDIPNSLDDLWTLDIKKSSAIPPEEVRENLKYILEKIAASSKQTYVYRGKKETKHPEKEIWNRMIARDKSIYYVINQEHPLVSNFITEHPEVKQQFLAILSQIQWNIPLNQLYLDMTNDEKVDDKVSNDEKINEETILSTLKAYLSNISNENKRKELFEDIISTSPFSEFKDAINGAVERGELP